MAEATKRGRGRPPIGGDDGSVEIKLAVPSPLHEVLTRLADAEGVPLAVLLRRILSEHVNASRPARRSRAR